MNRQQKFLLVFIPLLATALLLTLFACGKFQPPHKKKITMAVEQFDAPVVPQDMATTGYSDVSEVAVKSVVNISSVKVVRYRQRELPFFNDPFFRHFFGDPNRAVPRERRERSLGSGVIVSKDGYILTNNHVVADAAKVQVVLFDGREVTAKIVGTDSKTDLAIIKVDESDLDALSLGDSDKLRLGEVVLAIGSPFGLSHTVTMGIVSAKGRADVGIVDYEDFIQTDAAINPGNSGGALINSRGELVGINTAIFSRSGGYQGIGFAIPVNMAKMVMNSLIRYGHVERGYIGVYIQDVEAGMADHFGLDAPTGALVSDVVAGGPADQAGMRRGDVVLSFNGKDIQSSAMLRNLVSQTEIDSDAPLVILRDRKKMNISLHIGKRPDDENVDFKEPGQGPGEATDRRLGIELANVDGATRQRYDLPANVSGVIITVVYGNGTAAEAGLRMGDVIMQVNNQPIKNVQDFSHAIKNADESVLLLINRGGKTIYVELSLE